MSPQLHMPYRWIGFTVLPYGDSAGGSETGGSAASPDADKAGLTVMEAPHDQIRVEFIQDGLDGLYLLQAAEDGHD